MPLDETLRRLPPGAVEFARELLDFHWSEASWLYARREVMHVQGGLVPTKQWRELEARAKAHVVGLERGGRLVLDDCEARAIDGDRGELHAAMRVLCRRDEAAAWNGLIDAVAWHEPRRAAAVVDALVWDAPVRWQELVAAILADEGAPEDALGPLATVAGLRGWPLGDLLVGVLEDRVGDLAATAEAIARLQVGEGLAALAELVTSDQEASVRRAAVLGVSCFDPRGAVAFLGQLVGSEPWAALPLAMGAGADAFGLIVAAVERCKAPEGLVALGMLGCAEAVPVLLEALGDEALAEAAAEGLYLITGAELEAETRLVEETAEGRDDEDEDEDEDEEEEPSGLLVMRLPTSREVWTAWLEQHGPACLRQAGVRVRLGVPFEPGRVLDELGRTTLRPELREAMALELSIRYRVPQRFSTRLLVGEQEKGIAGLRAAVAGVRIEAGAWVFEGRALRIPGGRTRAPS